jgi:hypothetical protein
MIHPEYLPFLPGCFPPEFLMRDVPSRAHAGFMVRDVLLISIDLTEFRLTPRLMLSTALLPTSAKCYARVRRLSQDSLSELLFGRVGFRETVALAFRLHAVELAGDPATVPQRCFAPVNRWSQIACAGTRQRRSDILRRLSAAV